MKTFVCLLAVVSALAADSGLNPDAITKPLKNEWPTYNGDYSGARYSHLNQINQGNVRKLTLAWMMQPQSVGIKSMPLEVNGLLYFTTPDNVWSADARTGQIIWHYFREFMATISGNAALGCTGIGCISKRLIAISFRSTRRTVRCVGISNWPIRRWVISPRWRRLSFAITWWWEFRAMSPIFPDF